MKKTISLLLLLAGCILQGCYEDKGNYSYKEVSDPVVTGIEDSYKVFLGGNYDIRPTVEWTQGELENYSCTWRIDGKVISEEKELTGKVEGIPVKPNMYAEFVITNEDMGVEYINRFYISVSSEFSNGWLVLTDNGSKSELCLIRDDRKMYQNLYHTSNGADMASGATGLYEHWLPWSSQLGQIFVANPNGPDYSLELDGNSLQKIIATKDEFVGDLPSGFAPTSMSAVANYDYLTSNGKLYIRHTEKVWDAQYQDGLFPNFPYRTDFGYELSPWFTRGNLVFSNDIITFDKLSSSYLLLTGGELKKFNSVNDPEKKFIPYDMGKTVVGGGATATDTPTDTYITFLKSDTEEKAYVHRFSFRGWGAKKFKSLSEVEFPDPSIIQENSRFAVCKNRPYVYIAHRNTLYVYNYMDNLLKVLRDDFNRPIQDIALCPGNYERLGIILQNASDPGLSDFMELDVSVINQGQTVEGMEFIGKMDRGVSLVYKVGDQWTTNP